MVHEAQPDELLLIDKIVRASQAEFALVRITETMLGKSTIDANQSIVELMRQYKYFDFDSAVDGVKTYQPIKILGLDGWVESIISLYRPKAKPNKPGDPRFWPRGIKKSAQVGDLVFITVNKNNLVLIPLVKNLVSDLSINEEFPPKKITDRLNATSEVISRPLAESSSKADASIVSSSREEEQLSLSLEPTEDIESSTESPLDPSDSLVQSNDLAVWLKEVVRRLKTNVDRWVLSCSPSKSNPKDVGDTLESEFGLKVNNDGRADYHGIELKTKRRKAKTADTLFSQIPDQNLSPLRTAREIILTYGYLSRKPHRKGYKDLFVTVSNTPNPQGLYLLVNHENQTVEMRCTGKEDYNPNDHIVAVWTFEKLKQRLYEKHPVTAWILASEDKINGSIHFRYDGLEISKTPVFSQFLLLIERGIVVYDWRGGYHPEGLGQVDKGHPFRLKGIKNRDLLFGELEAIPLS